MDVSPQCIQFVRNRVVNDNKNLKNNHIEYFCNDPNSLCLETNYNSDDIDIIIMAFVMHHINKKNGDRESTMKEIYKACKPGGIFVVFELGKDYFKDKGHDKKVYDEPKSREEEEKQPLTADHDNDHGHDEEDKFENVEEIKEYVEGFGFRFDEQIMEDTFGDKEWILLFKKPIG